MVFLWDKRQTGVWTDLKCSINSHKCNVHSHAFPSTTTILPSHAQLAANDELCNVVREEQGLACLLGVLRASQDAALVRAAFATLRQLAASDACKDAFLELDGATDTLADALAVYEQQPLALEQVRNRV